MLQSVRLCLMTVVLSSIILAEPSAFSAGDLSKKAPYGLTESEKFILKNKKKIDRLSSKISKLQEKLDTVSSLFITTTSKLNKDILFVNSQLQSIETKIIDEVSSLDKNVSGRIFVNSTNIDQLKQILIELTNLTKYINNNYVNSKTLSSYVKKDELSKKQKISKTKTTINSKDKFKNLNGFDLLKKGESLISQKSFNSLSISVFKELIRRNYKSSRSNYYLGEIYFHTKKYKQALLHYKKSVKIYAKSDFMPNLLLHSGIASSKLSSKKNAIKFFKTLVSNFPKSKQAKQAKKLLAKY